MIDQVIKSNKEILKVSDAINIIVEWASKLVMIIWERSVKFLLKLQKHERGWFICSSLFLSQLFFFIRKILQVSVQREGQTSV